MEVIFEDNHLLIVVKPAGISTQEGLDEIAKQWLKEKYKKPGKVFLEPIHRLDKAVSGIVLFARTSKALSRLQAEMRAQKIQKTYIALVEGTLTNTQATLEHLLEHGDFRAHVSPHGKKAILHYKLIKSEKGLSKLEIDLETGRYHQIRAQFSAIGHPIVGDAKYGSQKHFSGPGIALHHSCIKFVHPVTKEKLTFRHFSKDL